MAGAPRYTPAQRRWIEWWREETKKGTWKPGTNPPEGWVPASERPEDKFAADEYGKTAQRLSQIYAEAAAELRYKSEAFADAHRARVMKYRKQVAEGIITEDDYRQWMQGQLFQEAAWRQRREAMARMMSQVDQQAAAIIDEGKLRVFGENASYLGYQLETAGGGDYGFGVYDEATLAHLIRDDPTLLPPVKVDVGKNILWYNKILQNGVIQGILQGESLDEIALRIVRITSEKSLSDMRRNARTAYTGAQNAGRLEGMRQAKRLGIKVKKKWLSFLDDSTRYSHQELDGQVQEVDDPFDSPLGPIMYPGDVSAAPGNVWNCRCRVVYVYPEYPSTLRRVDEDGQNWQGITYREWRVRKGAAA